MLHLICTSLLFLFFCRFFTKGISFFLALLFLIHPINVESVAYIGATQSELYFIPGITALLLAQKRTVSQARLLLIMALLLISIMTKETGFLFVLILITYRYIFELNKLKEFIFSTAVVITIYSLARIMIGGVTYNMTETIPIASLSLIDRMFHIPAIIVYYLTIFLFPQHLAVWQIWIIETPTLQNFVIPLILSCLFFIILLSIAYYLYKKDPKQYLQVLEQIKQTKHKEKIVGEKRQFLQFIFFLCWLTIGLGLLLQIVPLDMTVSDRWFYFSDCRIIGNNRYWTTNATIKDTLL